jgi:hypothetical protein
MWGVAGPDGAIDLSTRPAQVGPRSVQVVAHCNRLNVVRSSVASTQVRSAVGRNISD